MKTIVILAALVTIALSGGTALAKDYKATPDTLAALLPTLQPGDLVMLADGEYNGGFEIKVAGTKEAPIRIKAEGDKAIFRGGTNCFNIEGDYVELEGIKAYGARRAGVRVHANYDAVRKCVCGDNDTWGIFSGFAEGIVVEDNECYGSKKEHGIYLSNSADHAVVRRNHCYNNGRCGIQFNGDPNIPGGDGVMSFNLVEGNILHDNANCFNMTCMAESVVRNNLFYNQNTKGIALWDTMAGFQYSSKNNLIINNTIIVDRCTRECIQIRRGATGNVIRNNILVTKYQAIVCEPSAVEGTVIDHNIYFGSIETERFMWAGEYRTIDDMQEAGYCQGDKEADPKFANVADADYHLLPDSPAIGIGVVDPKAGDVDLGGQPRTRDGKIDIGAYEFQGVSVESTGK